jgi:crotonobetainyl-CoA:carnitine CoA-transferase CaiB-like acyl-CoA transferase
MTAPLAGLTILDLTRLLPGPAATIHLADFGAEVIKIEDLGDGDYLRGFPPFVRDANGRSISPTYIALNRGKRSLRLNLKSAQGREALLRLAERADAVVESFRPGTLDKLGLGWNVLHARAPRLVLCSISGYGQQGPLRLAAGHDLNYIALAGVLDQIRSAQQPAIPNFQLGDVHGGTLTALAALLIALLAAQRTGSGRQVDVAMTDALLAHHVFPHGDLDSGTTPTAGATLLTGGVACYQVYFCADGRHLAVGALELKFWRNFCAAVGLDALTDVHWSTDAAQAPGSAGARATTAQVAAHLATQPRAHWLAQLAGADACAAPVLTPADALAQPQVAARQLVHRVAGVTHVGPLAQIGGHAFAVAATETAGASSRTVLKEAGYSDSEIDALIAADVVGEAAT